MTGRTPELASLSPAKELAISVLLDEPVAALENALADYLLDHGLEYATALAARVKEEAEVESRLRAGHLIRYQFEQWCRQRAQARARGDTRHARQIGESIGIANMFYLDVTGSRQPLIDPTEGESATGE